MYRIYTLFFLSGAAGLIYQVVWSRLLNEMFGVTVYATSAVLATFLIGLALGGWVLGRVADRWRDPLRLYGWLEIGIGLAAFAGTWWVRLLEPLHIWAANRFAADAVSLIGFRMLLAAVVVLPPTILMGGTLPVITRAAVDRLPRVGREFSTLYGWNTLGAVLGTLAAGFALIRAVGLHPTLWIAVVVNLGVGLVSLRLAAAGKVSGGRAGPEAVETVAEVPPVRSAEGAGLLLVMAVSGFASLGLEVLWTRVLVMSVGTTTYAFVTMLAAFLTGIALGSFLARRVMERTRHLRAAFGCVQVGIAASVLATVPLLGAGLAQDWLRGLGGQWLLLIVMRFVVSFLVMLVPTTLIGMTLPLAACLWTRKLDTLGGRLGQLYGANTAGNIAGALAGGFFLLPLLGLRAGIVVCGALNLIAAMWAFLPRGNEQRRTVAHVLRVTPVVGLGLCAMLLGLWRPGPFAAWEENPGDRAPYYREGVAATVKVVEAANDPDLLWMTVDGITIGQSFGGVDAKQQALAHFPFLLMPGNPPRRVLSIGLGTGILVGEAAKHSSVEAIEVLEISPSVIEAARWFDRFSGSVLDNPVLRVIHDDGVNYLRRTDRRYDAIISDAKSRTAHAGNSLFFSEDYYRLCRQHLADGGLMIQWTPIEVPPRELRTILRTFLGVFPDGQVWLSPPHSGFLVGTKRPLTVDLAHVGRLLSDPVTENLRRYGWRDVYGFASLLTADRSTLRDWLDRETTLNSLEHPVLEFYSPRAYAVRPARRRAENLAALLEARRGPVASVSFVNGDPSAIETARRATSDWIDALVRIEGRGDGGVDEALDLLDRAVRSAPFHGPLLQAAPGVYRRALHRNPDSARAHRSLGLLLGANGRFDEALSHLQQAVRLAPRDGAARVHLAMTLRLVGRIDEALEQYREAARLQPDDAAALSGLAFLLAAHPDAAVRDPERAVALAERAAELTREGQILVLDALAAAYASAGRFEQAVTTLQSALSLLPDGAGPPDLMERFRLYRQRKPYRLSSGRVSLSPGRAP